MSLLASVRAIASNLGSFKTAFQSRIYSSVSAAGHSTLYAGEYEFKSASGSDVPIHLYPLTPVVKLQDDSKIPFDQVPQFTDRENEWWKAKYVHAWLRSFSTGEYAGLVELDRSVFGSTVRQDLLRRGLRYEEAWMKQGTESTKALGQVRGTTKKAYAQKGRGKARVGTLRAPQFRGGYNVHGPRPHLKTHDINRKVYDACIRTGLSTKFAQDQITIVDSLALAEEGKEELRQRLENLNMMGKRCYVLYGSEDPTEIQNLISVADSFERLRRSEELPHGERPVVVAWARNVSLTPMMDFEHLIIDKAAVEVLEEMYRVD
ncbi:ribosomal protein L4 domain-containing protein [Polychytrium aggregatum]|uniref:ribosomal protein L4 domain-containing protein n=1 Tax=Polychytrium aggregatum TaxID=110093 RepID=UPI0022FF1519|nr:ribosomal protein L4 domain-containing protein [Polychytrium aggregatum]KAI9202080.1 ribosomal protein L4 domain-containing protein [Polychytrium aggregatum]